ncbi:MAG: HD domain-containing protein [Caldilinea sp. CFX5]|nr:HD domain-containing protein [Caldilinea sp. CFX5]
MIQGAPAVIKTNVWQTGYYRLRQFWRGWFAAIDPVELQRAVAYLPPAAQMRFQTLPIDAQRHSLNVLQTLQRRSAIPADLAAAALLHDIGKLAADEAGLRINLWVRGPLVLLDKLAPHWLERWASTEKIKGWRYLLYVHLRHPAIGAQWATAWECTPLTCWLIEHHQDDLTSGPSNEAERLLVLLQWADELN